MNIIPGAVREKFSEIMTCTKGGVTVDSVIELIKEQYKRPVHIIEARLPNGVSGYALALLDAVVIIINKKIDPDRRIGTVFHELSHFLLKHPKVESYTFKQFKKARNDITKMLAHEPVTAYDDPIEYAAETLGMMLLEQFEVYKKTLSQDVGLMYGYTL